MAFIVLHRTESRSAPERPDRKAALTGSCALKKDAKEPRVYIEVRVNLMSISRSTYFHSSVLRSLSTIFSNASECWGEYSNHVRKSNGSLISRL
jgi:hypothetical protein